MQAGELAGRSARRQMDACAGMWGHHPCIHSCLRLGRSLGETRRVSFGDGGDPRHQ